MKTIADYLINISGERQIASLIIKIKEMFDLVDFQSKGSQTKATQTKATQTKATQTKAIKVAAVTTVALELARNIIAYAGRGTISLHLKSRGNSFFFEIEAKDFGPGIEDLELVLQDHYSTGGTLGLGLPGVKRLMDEFKIESSVGEGTKVWAQKWL